MNPITITGIGASSVAMGGGKQAWRRLPDGIRPIDAVRRGWVVVATAPLYGPEHLILCQEVVYHGGPKAGIYWEPVKLNELPKADMPECQQ